MLSGEGIIRSVKQPAFEFHLPPGRRPCLFLSLLLLFLAAFAACGGSRVKKDLSLARDFRPREVQTLAVVNLDPHIQFSYLVEAQLLKKGYKVKESSSIARLLKDEGLLKEGALDPAALAEIGRRLQVQGIVLCSVLEFSRFRDSYRLSIRCVSPETGNTLWLAEGSKESRRGQKSSELLKEIVVSSLKSLPAVP
jgi:hypothetical protein